MLRRTVNMRPALLLGLAGLLSVSSAQAWPRVDAQLNAAAAAGNVAAIEQAIAEGANPDQARALAAAVAGKHREAVDDLLRHHADPNAWARGSAYALSGPEGSPVFQAAKLGDWDVLLDLVRHGADLNAESRWGYIGDTPLAFAVRYGQLGAVRLLIEAGADVNHAAANGETPLRNAFYGEPNAVQIVQLLMAHGADPDIKDGQGKTAREISYSYDPPGMRVAIERARPSPPFARPEEMASISQVLLCRAADAAMIPGYGDSTRAAYDRWRAPRAAVITQIEGAAQYRSALTRLLRQPAGAAAGPEEIESQCDLILPRELVPAHLSQSVRLQRLQMTLICKASYDILIPGYKTGTQRAYAGWRASHRAALAQIESTPQFRQQRAEAIRGLAGNEFTAVSSCAGLMPPDLRASVGENGPEAATLIPDVVAAPPPAVLNQASVKVRMKTIVRSAPSPTGVMLSPQKPQ